MGSFHVVDMLLTCVVICLISPSIFGPPLVFQAGGTAEISGIGRLVLLSETTSICTHAKNDRYMIHVLLQNALGTKISQSST